MNSIAQLIERLSTRQKFSLVLTALAVGGGIYSFTRWNTERDFQPLYTGLASEDAGAVVAKLKEAQAEYRVGAGGGTILVPSAKVAEVRLQMAANGLPKTGRIGFELFDKTNFGTTDFAEQVNFRRALEGELERSVMALAEVERARVHIAPGKDSLFLESRQPAKASVLVTLKPGAHLSPQNVQAIAHLTASAVEGLAPENVSVLDRDGNLLSRPRRGSLNGEGMDSSDAALEYRQQVEKDLLAKINSTLEPLLGPEKYRAGVSVDCDFSSGEQSEETFDPSKSVMMTSQKTEDISGTPGASGVPGTASTLPRATGRSGQASNGMTRRTENVTYQTSRTVKRVRLPQGTVKRMSVSVLVAHHVRWEGTGAKARRIIEPPAPERLKAIEKLVAGIIGVVPERGDTVIVESLPFEGVPGPDAPADPAGPRPAPPPSNLPPWIPKQVTPMMLGIAAVVLLLLVAVPIGMWIGRGKKKKIEAQVKPAIEAAQSEAEAAKDTARRLEAQLHDQEAERERQTVEAIAALKLPPAGNQKTEVLTKHLAAEAKKHPENLAQVLRSWLNEEED